MEQKSLFTYFLECFTKNYFNFEGRARRKEYWGFMLFYSLLLVLQGVLVFCLFIDPLSEAVSTNLLTPIVTTIESNIALFVVWGIFLLLTLIPAWAVQTRRLHDRGMSGWWVLAGNVLPVLYLYGWCTSDSFSPSFFSTFGNLGIFVFIWGHSILDGERGANKYGPNPKYPEGMYY